MSAGADEYLPKVPEATNEKFSVRDLIDYLDAEAQRIRSTQRALVRANLAVCEHPDEMRRARALDVVRHMLIPLVRVWPKVQQLMRQEYRR